MSTPDQPTPISRRESLKRAAGALALGLGAPVAALAATDDEEVTDFRLSFWKVEEGEKAFHTLRLSREDADRIMSGLGRRRTSLAYIKLDGVEGERTRTVASFYIKME